MEALFILSVLTMWPQKSHGGKCVRTVIICIFPRLIHILPTVADLIDHVWDFYLLLVVYY